MDKQEQKKVLIGMMKDDEELGLYDEPKQEDEFCYYSGLPSPAAYSKEEPNMISDWLEQNRNPEIDKQVEKELEYISRQEIKLEEVFNDDKKENIKKFIDEVNNPSQPNDKLKQAFEKYSEYLEDYENKNTYEHGFKDGAKWQQERMYSEEEIIELLQKALTHKDDGEIGSLVTAQGEIRPANFFSWFNKFKKK